MEPLSPNDPLHALLGKARPVEPRSNFTQNVLREIRQVPQSLTLWERVQAWVGGFSAPRLAFAGAAAVVVLVGGVMALQEPASQTPQVAVQVPAAKPVTVQVHPSLIQPPVHEVSTAMIYAATAGVLTPAEETDAVDPMGLLVVGDDTSSLTNTELALLVY